MKDIISIDSEIDTDQLIGWYESILKKIMIYLIETKGPVELIVHVKLIEPIGPTN